ncbi:MAG: flavodoxin family protein BilS [Longibaculum sp.]
MKYSIIYSSATGNTAMLAKHILKTLSNHECLYDGQLTDTINIENNEILFIGFWTDKGVCDEKMQTFLKSLHNQKIFLFGTAGFGGSQQYFDAIIERVKAFIDDTNQIVGTFMCQGKMPMSIRERYVSMAKKDPQRFQPMIDNFDQALSHPSQDDLQSLTSILEKIS